MVMAYPHQQLDLIKKPTLRLCSSSPKISVFERQLSLMKTPAIMHNYINSPAASRSVFKYGSNPSPSDQSSSNSSDATLVASGNKIDYTNSLKRDQVNVKLFPTSKASSPKFNNESSFMGRSKSIDFKIPVQEIINFKNDLDLLINDSLKVLNSITKRDVDLFLDHLSEIIIGIFVVFGVEIMHLNKDGFLVLVQLVTASVIRIGFKAGDHDSLLLQSPIVSIFDRSNLPIEIKRSVTHLITTLQIYILLSIFRITAVFKKEYVVEESKIDSLSIMGLGVVMVLLCLNLIINSLPASRRYNCEVEA